MKKVLRSSTRGSQLNQVVTRPTLILHLTLRPHLLIRLGQGCKKYLANIGKWALVMSSLIGGKVNPIAHQVKRYYLKSIEEFMFQAVIFDFDGVILDSEPLHYEACSHVFKQLGLALSYTEYVEKYLGLSDKEMFPKLFSAKNLCFSLDKINALIEEKTKQYQEIIKLCDSLPMIDSVDLYIDYISQKIPKLAICSGSTRNEIMAVLTKFKHGALQAYFDTIVASEDIQHGKPSPEGYLLTAKRLNVSPSECLVIEDTPHGIEAAKKAGMHVIALLTSYKKEQLQHADKIISHFNQLILEEITIEI